MDMQVIELLESRIAPATFVVTTLNDAGAGSLRNAIATANDHEGADVIVLEKGLVGTIEITGGQMMITDTLKIKGPGTAKLALDADSQSRIFFVSDGDDVKDSPLSVSSLSFVRGEQLTGAGESGGAIASAESLNVKACAFVGNVAAGAIAIVQHGNAPLSVRREN